jgi:hypothetical protein
MTYFLPAWWNTFHNKKPAEGLYVIIDKALGLAQIFDYGW